MYMNVQNNVMNRRSGVGLLISTYASSIIEFCSHWKFLQHQLWWSLNLSSRNGLAQWRSVFLTHTLHRLWRDNLNCWKQEVPDLQVKVCPKAVSWHLSSQETSSPWIVMNFVAFFYFKWTPTKLTAITRAWPVFFFFCLSTCCKLQKISEEEILWVFFWQ